MIKKTNKKETVSKKCCHNNIKSTCKEGAIYAFGMIGAMIYYISTATSFWGGVLGFVKSIFWPIFLVHGLMKFLGL